MGVCVLVSPAMVSFIVDMPVSTSFEQFLSYAILKQYDLLNGVFVVQPGVRRGGCGGCAGGSGLGAVRSGPMSQMAPYSCSRFEIAP